MGSKHVHPGCSYLHRRRMAEHLEANGEEAMISSGESVFNVLVDGKIFPGRDISNPIYTIQSWEEIALESEKFCWLARKTIFPQCFKLWN